MSKVCAEDQLVDTAKAEDSTGESFGFAASVIDVITQCSTLLVSRVDPVGRFLCLNPLRIPFAGVGRVSLRGQK